MIRTLLADDHAVFCEGLGRILASSDGIEIVGEARSGAEALELAKSLHPDVVVLDVWMPGRGGVETIQELKRAVPKLCILVLTAHPEDHYAVRCLRSGADGYVTKDRRADEIVAAIRRIHAGGVFVSAALAELLALNLKGDARLMPLQTLSDREFEVLTMIAGGKTVSEIAGELHLSVKTVSTYRSRVLVKLHLKNNAEIMRFALEEGLSWSAEPVGEKTTWRPTLADTRIGRTRADAKNGVHHSRLRGYRRRIRVEGGDMRCLTGGRSEEGQGVILLVEDNPSDVRLTQEALIESKATERLHVAYDGEQAIAFLRKRNGHTHAPTPALIILDLNLPRMDGREVLAEIKSDEGLRRIPVVVLTTSTSEDDVTRSYGLHANCYVTKPIELECFIDVIQSIRKFWLTTARLPSAAA